MDRTPDIDMMILKDAGTVKLKEALRNKPNEVFVAPAMIEYRPIIKIEGQIFDTGASDPLTRAMRRSSLSRWGYYPKSAFY